MSNDGMTMIFLKELVMEQTAEKPRVSKAVVTFLDRRGKFPQLQVGALEIPVNTKEEIAWFMEFVEMLEKISENFRGY